LPAVCQRQKTKDVDIAVRVGDEAQFDIALPSGQQLKICSLEGLVMLKIIAYGDRPSRTKDIADIDHIIHYYFELSQDNIYEDHFDVMDLYPTSSTGYLQFGRCKSDRKKNQHHYSERRRLNGQDAGNIEETSDRFMAGAGGRIAGSPWQLMLFCQQGLTQAPKIKEFTRYRKWKTYLLPVRTAGFTCCRPCVPFAYFSGNCLPEYLLTSAVLTIIG
jgi:hypothetical protein